MAYDCLQDVVLYQEVMVIGVCRDLMNRHLQRPDMSS